jgi:hypothetical protein
MRGRGVLRGLRKCLRASQMAELRLLGVLVRISRRIGIVDAAASVFLFLWVHLFQQVRGAKGHPGNPSLTLSVMV